MRQIDLDRLVHVTMRQLPDVGVDRGRQQQRLARRGQLAEDSLDVGPEPDVEHAIGLIEHDVNDVAQIERSSLDVVEHAARGADDQVDSPRECANLFFNRLAAKHAADRDGRPHRQLLQLGDDLLRQLASRRQHDRLRTTRSGFEHLDQRNSKRGRLPGARLGLADDVETFESFGNKCRLDGGGRQVADSS